MKVNRAVLCSVVLGAQLASAFSLFGSGNQDVVGQTKRRPSKELAAPISRREFGVGDLGEYQFCDFDSDCSYPYYCYNYICVQQYGISGLGVGEHCYYSGNCLYNRPCVIPANKDQTNTDLQVCARRGLQGDPCTDNTACEPSLSCARDGTCRYQSYLDGPCASDYECPGTDNFCLNGYCRYLYNIVDLPTGSHCALSYQCHKTANCTASPPNTLSTNTDLFNCQALLPAGAVCQYDFDCEGDIRCRGGKCRVSREMYQSCASDYECYSANYDSGYCLHGICSERYGYYNLPAGEHCVDDSDCYNYSPCVANATAPDNSDLMTCVVLKKEGDVCEDFSNQCSPDLFCNGQKCQKLVLNGGSCTSDQQCYQSNACIRGTCRDAFNTYDVQPNEHCVLDYNCAGNQGCSVNINTNLQLCVPQGAQGDSCLTNVDCSSPTAQCRGSTCLDQKAIGQACTTDYACSSSWCLDKVCRDPTKLKVAAGLHCASDFNCGTAGFCTASGTSSNTNLDSRRCVTRTAAQSCSSDGDCPSGVAGSTCRSGQCFYYKDAYDPCNSDLDCNTGFCAKTVQNVTRNICIYPYTYYTDNNIGYLPGEHCYNFGDPSQPNNCANGATCSRPAGSTSTSTDVLICQAGGLELATCSSNAGCTYPRLCRGGKCRTQQQVYDPCSSDYACVDGSELFCYKGVCRYTYSIQGSLPGDHCSPGTCGGSSPCSAPAGSTTPDNTDTWVCQALAGDGATCSASSDCQYPRGCSQGKCYAQKSDYASCTTDVMCQSGYCFNQICQQAYYTYPGYGEHCSPFYVNCPGGYSPCNNPPGTDSSNTDLYLCTALGVAGDSCSIQEECQYPLACTKGLCRTQQPLYASCDSDYDCLSSFCYYGTCLSQHSGGVDGDHCIDDSSCAGGWNCYVPDFDNTDSSYCVYSSSDPSPAGEGEYCDNDVIVCHDSSACLNNACVTQLPNYSPCQDDVHCYSSYCLYGVCRDPSTATNLGSSQHCIYDSNCLSSLTCADPTGDGGFYTDGRTCGGVVAGPTTTHTHRTTTTTTTTTTRTTTSLTTTTSSKTSSTTTTTASPSASAGTKANGAVCQSDYDCLSSWCLSGKCADSSTSGPKVAVPGHCHTDYNCGQYAKCYGQPAPHNSDSFICIKTNTTFTATKCTVPADCGANAGCGGGFCYPYKSPYDPCVNNVDCSTLICDASSKTCAAGRSNGAVCQKDGDCLSTWCLSGKCTDSSTSGPKVALGTHCHTNYNCGSAAICSGADSDSLICIKPTSSSSTSTSSRMSTTSSSSSTTPISTSRPTTSSTTTTRSDPLTHDTTPPGPTPTQRAANGAACQLDSSCNSGYCLSGKCTEGTTSGPKVAVPGHCHIDYNCGSTALCFGNGLPGSSDSFACVKSDTTVTATKCTASSNCPGGSYCKSGSCFPLKGLYDPCLVNADCASGLCPSSTLLCAPGIITSTTRSTTTSSPTSKTSTSTSPASSPTTRLSNGAVCSADAVCTSGFCLNGKCTDGTSSGPKVAVPSHCHIDYNCGSAALCFGNGLPSNSDSFACVKSNTAVTSTKCTSSANCPTGAYCKSGSCFPLKLAYDPCLVDADCASGICPSSTLVCAPGSTTSTSRSSTTASPSSTTSKTSTSTTTSPASSPTTRLSNGAVCSADAVCTSGFCLNGKCTDGTSGGPKVAVPSHCHIDYNCGSAALCFGNGLPSSSDSFACVKTNTAVTSTKCTASSNCPAGAYCKAGSCFPLKLAYDPCLVDADCASGVCPSSTLVCAPGSVSSSTSRSSSSSSKTTTTPTPYTTAATTNPTTTSRSSTSSTSKSTTSVAPTSAPLSPIGASCPYDYSCASYWCLNGKCADSSTSGPKVAVGQHCHTDYNCGSAALCYGSGSAQSSPTLFCVKTNTTITSTKCTSSAQCPDKAGCRNGACYPYKLSYDPCLINSDCYSGTCMTDSLTCAPGGPPSPPSATTTTTTRASTTTTRASTTTTRASTTTTRASTTTTRASTTTTTTKSSVPSSSTTTTTKSTTTTASPTRTTTLAPSTTTRTTTTSNSKPNTADSTTTSRVNTVDTTTTRTTTTRSGSSTTTSG